MQNTINYLLKKPEITDNVNIVDLNENADIVDQALKNNAEAVATLSDSVTEALSNISSAAQDTSIIDAEDYFTSSDVEGALQEVGQVLNSIRGNLITSTNNILGM